MNRYLGCHTIYGVDKEHDTPYLTRLWIGRLRLHIFHRGDADPDCHDHPWDFWTFPLTAYVEEVAIRAPDPFGYLLVRQVVNARRWHFRPTQHTHRVIGRLAGYLFDGVFYSLHALPSKRLEPDAHRIEAVVKPGKIVTIVWQGKASRKWGFLRNRDGKWCWTPWREYVFGGGKHAPCEPESGA